MTVVAGGYVHWNVTVENVEHSLNAKVMTIVSVNFDSMPNAILDSMLNVYNLHVWWSADEPNGKKRREKYAIDLRLYINQ